MGEGQKAGIPQNALREYEKQKDGTVGMEEDQNSDDGLGYDDDDDGRPLGGR